MKYNLTKEGVNKWNANSGIRVGEDTLFEVEHIEGEKGIVLVDMCDIESPKMALNASCVVPAKQEPQKKQRSPIVVSDEGGVYLAKEIQDQLDNIEKKLNSIVAYLGGVYK